MLSRFCTRKDRSIQETNLKAGQSFTVSHWIFDKLPILHSNIRFISHTILILSKVESCQGCTGDIKVVRVGMPLKSEWQLTMYTICFPAEWVSCFSTRIMWRAGGKGELYLVSQSRIMGYL